MIKFNEREWINDMVVGAVTGLLAGAVMAMFVPDPPVTIGISAGGIGGLITGLVIQPLKWVLERRPNVESEKDHDES